MYGLTKQDREFALKKIKDSKFFLDNNFVSFSGKDFALSQFTKNAYVNADRYIASIYNRVYSLYRYSQIHNLVNVFVTLTLPTEYHKMRTIKKKSGKYVLVSNKNFIDDLDHTPKAGSKQLSKMLKRLFDSRVYKSISKDKRAYFRVTEPHKDGTPHLHISFFISPEHLDKFIETVERLYPAPLSKVEKNVNNPVSYLMKYILKTLDDLRIDKDNYTDLSLWYITHGICRFYTSRTLIALEIYNKVYGRHSLLCLTHMYKDKELDIWYDEKGRLVEILEKVRVGPGVDWFLPIWQDTRIDSKEFISTPYKARTKLEYKKLQKAKVKEDNELVKIYIDGVEFGYIKNNEVIKKTVFPALLSDLSLSDYYHSLDPDDLAISYQHFGITQEEMISRGLLRLNSHKLSDYKI